MDASILLVGDDPFQSLVSDLIYDLTPFAVEAVADPFEAMLLVQAQQPDLLLIQAETLGSLDLCRQIKSQSRLAWIYCLVLDYRVSLEGLSLPELHQWQERENTARINALEAGADAYFPWLANVTRSESASSELADPESTSPGDLELLRRMLQAQIQAGWRQVQNHRELIRANDVLSAIALADPLTELNNRRAFEWELPRQIQNARNRNMPISLIMLDIDFFKSINDTHGHLVGDSTLQLFAARLRHNLRFYDTPFRYGGEEFAIILSDTDRYEAVKIANRICQLIREQPFAIDETLDLTITISAGTATLKPEDDPKGISLLQRADQRLLQAKGQGRDRVVGCVELISGT